MQPRMLLIVALLALLASTRASEEEEPLLGSVQGYMEQAAKKVQHALSSVQQSEMATQARDWMDNGFSSLRGYFSKLTNKFAGFWDPIPEVLPTPATEP